MLKIPTRGRFRSSGRPDVVLHKVLQISLVKVMRFRLAVNGAAKPWPFQGGTAETRFEHWVMMGINQVKYYKYGGGSIKWGIPNSWLVYDGESDLKMDDLGVPPC